MITCIPWIFDLNIQRPLIYEAKKEKLKECESFNMEITTKGMRKTKKCFNKTSETKKLSLKVKEKQKQQCLDIEIQEMTLPKDSKFLRCYPSNVFLKRCDKKCFR